MSDLKGPWTDEEINRLVSMWPNATAMQIAARLHRSYASVRDKMKRLRQEGLWEAKEKHLRKKGLLEATDTPRRRSNRPPDPQVFDEVKRDYCRKHNITITELYRRFESDGQLVGKLYRLAVAVYDCRSASGTLGAKRLPRRSRRGVLASGRV